MGLSFDYPGRAGHEAPSWSYTNFNVFRERVAENATGPDDPIMVLLNHSDCDGEMSPQECAACAPRRVAIVSGWDGVDGYRGKRLAEAMALCALHREPLVFT